VHSICWSCCSFERLNLSRIFLFSPSLSSLPRTSFTGWQLNPRSDHALRLRHCLTDVMFDGFSRSFAPMEKFLQLLTHSARLGTSLWTARRMYGLLDQRRELSRKLDARDLIDLCIRTYKQFYEDEVALPTVTKNPKGMSYRPKLVPYDMNSIVNQLPVRFDREPLHGVRFCAPRNISQFGWDIVCVSLSCSHVRHRLGDRPYERQYVTSNKNSFVQHHGLPVGFTNQGIMSEKTRFLHWKQSL